MNIMKELIKKKLAILFLVLMIVFFYIAYYLYGSLPWNYFLMLFMGGFPYYTFNYLIPLHILMFSGVICGILAVVLFIRPSFKIKRVKKSTIVILISILAIVGFGIYFYATSTGLPSQQYYSDELTAQWLRQNYYVLTSDGHISQMAGEGWGVYNVSGTLKLYSCGVYPGATCKFEETLTLDSHGIISNSEWQESLEVFTAWVDSLGGVVPTDGYHYFYISSNIIRGFNVIHYHLYPGDTYITVDSLGLFENGVLTLYDFEV